MRVNVRIDSNEVGGLMMLKDWGPFSLGQTPSTGGGILKEDVNNLGNPGVKAK